MLNGANESNLLRTEWVEDLNNETNRLNRFQAAPKLAKQFRHFLSINIKTHELLTPTGADTFNPHLTGNLFEQFYKFFHIIGGLLINGGENESS